MFFSRRVTIFANCSSLISVVAFMLKYQLNRVVLLVALALLVLNLYNILGELLKDRDMDEFKRSINFSPSKKEEKIPSSRFNVREFEDRVKEAIQKNTKKNGGYIAEENKYWSNKFYHKNEKIEEIKTLRISDLARDRVAKDEDETSLRFQVSTLKKIRNYLEGTQHKEEPSNIKEIKTYLSEQLKEPNISEEKINKCLNMIEQHINTTINNDYETMVSDFNAADKFLRKCFSLSLTLHPSSSASTISYEELMEIVKLIENKGTLPSRFTASISPLQVSKELAAVRHKIGRLPHFYLSPNILKLEIFMKYLKREFQDENIVFSSVEQGSKMKDSGKNHLFKFTDSQKLYYNRAHQTKSFLVSTPVLLLCLNLFEKYKKKNRGLLQDIISVLEI